MLRLLIINFRAFNKNFKAIRHNYIDFSKFSNVRLINLNQAFQNFEKPNVYDSLNILKILKCLILIIKSLIKFQGPSLLSYPLTIFTFNEEGVNLRDLGSLPFATRRRVKSHTFYQARDIF